MKIYTVHIRRHGLDPDRDLVLVPEGFTVFGFLLTVVWALYHRLWLATAILVGLRVVIVGLAAWVGINPVSMLIIDLLFAALFGMFGNDFRRHKLGRLGYDDCGVVSGRSRSTAERRFLDQNPAMTGMIAEGASE